MANPFESGAVDPRKELPKTNPEHEESEREVEMARARRETLEVERRTGSASEEKALREKTFELGGRTFEAEDPLDFSLAELERGISELESEIKNAREKNDYFLEKDLLRLLSLKERLYALQQIHADVRSQRPDLAEVLEERHPGLRAEQERAEELYRKAQETE